MSRIERDSLGERELPDDAYYGVQTLRGWENFHITGLPVSRELALVKAFGYVKKAAALANMACRVLDQDIGNAIVAACDRIIAGEFADQFITDSVQGGAGTSVNMNANEVIANVALEMTGRVKGDYAVINPNDHVNCSQSTNDTYPTALRLALMLRLHHYAETLELLRDAFREKGGASHFCLRCISPDFIPISISPSQFQCKEAPFTWFAPELPWPFESSLQLRAG